MITNSVLLQVYVSGNALVVLGGPHDLIQTIYHDGQGALEAVAIDEASGKIATCTEKEVYIYRPYGRIEGALKVSSNSTREGAKILMMLVVVSPVYATDPRKRTRIVYSIVGFRGGAVGGLFHAETIPDSR